MFGLGDMILLADLAVVVSGSGSSVIAKVPPIGDSAWNVNNLSGDTVSLEILLDMKLALGPLASWGIWAEEEHETCSRNDEDEWDDESHAPCNMGGQVLA